MLPSCTFWTDLNQKADFLGRDDVPGIKLVLFRRRQMENKDKESIVDRNGSQTRSFS